MAALNVSKGTMRVGATPDELLRFGAVMLALGGCLGLPPLAALCAGWCRRRAKGGGFAGLSQADDAERPLPPRRANL